MPALEKMTRLMRILRSWWALTGFTGLFLLAGCTPSPLQPPEQSGELVVVTRNSPTTYFLDIEGNPSGFEFDLASRFAASQGWKIRFLVADSLDELLEIVADGQAHIAAAGLTASEARRRTLQFGPTYGQVKELLVCGPNVKLPRDVKDLVGLRVEVVAGSSHAEHLKLYQRRIPALQWVALDVASSEELLERVEMGLADCTVSDSDSLDVARNFHPLLRQAFVLSSAQPLAWLVGSDMQTRFSRQLAAFFKEMEKDRALVKLRERYFGHVTRLKEADVRGILEKRSTLLHEFKPHLQAAQVETGLDWRLLAAVAYQESQWDAHAVSFTGVRGLMMLTEQTADHLGVKDRLDPRESILGGARYIIMLRDGLPPEIPEPDRTWMALAAYNIGSGHLHDARRLTRSLGKNPDSWADLKSVLPLLARREYAGKLKYGFARGGEARAMTENVRIYFDILARYEKPYREFLALD
jgi:membrane-bound lytic murein transglycosylase F